MVVPVLVTTVEIVPMKRTSSILLRPNLRVMPRCAASVEDGLHPRRGHRDACHANMVALLSKNGNEHIASFSSSHRRSVRVERSSAQSTTQLRCSRDDWWYARFGFISSSVATDSAPSSGALLSPKSDMPWHHQAKMSPMDPHND